MPQIRVLSWNIRTFGAHELRNSVLREIEDLIRNSEADIVCIQELQSGTGAAGDIGAEVVGTAAHAAFMLFFRLSIADPGARWMFKISGLNNSSRSSSMRDAYLYLWKEKPAGSSHAHGDPVDEIELYQEPIILRQPGRDLFPGRRPGMTVFGVTPTSGARTVPFKVISWHAATPCNSIAKGGKTSSGRALIELATLTEIGGVAPRVEGRTYVDKEVNPLPDLDTIVLGDFNYSLDKAGAGTAFSNLLKFFEPCVAWDGHIPRTTYSADPMKPFEGTSSYDNIFCLKGHGDFAPTLTWSKGTGVIDFIAEKAKQLGAASGIRYFAEEAAWYVIYVDNYKKQYGISGLSDHLPVFADFNVGAGSAETNRIQPTSGANNNCLFNAALGHRIAGLYRDLDAAAHRTEFADWLAGRNAGNIGAARDELLRAMIAHYEGSPLVVASLQELLSNDEDIFADDFFVGDLASYIASIRGGRMLYWHEAALLAMQRGITINLYRSVPGHGIQPIALNPGQGTSADIYHFGVHFFHYDTT